MRRRWAALKARRYIAVKFSLDNEVFFTKNQQVGKVWITFSNELLDEALANPKKRDALADLVSSDAEKRIKHLFRSLDVAKQARAA